ncbi:selenium cofactor biosynthesis protein YqeC [Halopiger aswanensis]|uniref:Putative selenium-dependent hydroxylase accessory protein YqeC n=1 Tax=Halopiger aswanensis TaxID=148449 RepID=A0A3R7DYW1_9EURY|nr:selenium cofactor biosynthesis protein YqeC [Halopiger aswanensis]RKD94827.1 putative selenium-dependent hydroxylase accessory protein YqeC [Halopiger aswanensis]
MTPAEALCVAVEDEDGEDEDGRKQGRIRSDPTAAVAVVGAGGKKTTLYTLAEQLERAVVTASVRIPIFDSSVSRVAVTESPLEALRSAEPADFPLGLVPEQEGESRYLGYDTAAVDRLIEAHDGPVLIKADGARMREFKAPNDREPQLPSATDVVVPIASAHVVGERLTDEVVHRPERVAAVAGDAGLALEVGDVIEPAHVAAVLASEEGGLKDVPDGAAVVPLVNKVDDADDEAVARDIAREFYEQVAGLEGDGEEIDADTGVTVDLDSSGRRATVPYVVLARMADGVVVDRV